MAALQRHALPFPRRLPAPRLFGWLRSGKGLLTLAILLVLAVAVLQVNQFSRLTSTGYQIDQLSQLRAAKQAQNHELEAEVARLSSLARVDWDARVDQHMVPATRKLYVSVNQPVPRQETLPTRFLPRASAAATTDGQAGDPIWKRLLRLLPFF